jgi:tetratricopeptide (TPR) repeat protein
VVDYGDPMTNRLTESLRESPTTVPALAAVALFVVWATDQAGYPVTHWAPGGIIVLGLVGVALFVVRLRWSEIPLTVRIAAGCLAGYTALSFLSITWAGVPGAAWEGANRTLLYLLVFVLFACWRQRGRSAALVLGVWALAIIGVAAFTLLHLDAASDAGLQNLIPYTRLVYPSGYANANAALWLMAFWPALLLARSAQVHWGLRGVLAGGAVLLADVALLSQSRGSLYATPVMVVLVLALLPGRIRTFAVLVPIAAGVAAAAPSVLHVGDRLQNEQPAVGAMHSASTASFVAAVAVALVVALASAIEGRVTLSESGVRRIRKTIGTVAIAGLVAVVAGGWVAAGDPVARVRHGWETFKGGDAEEAPTSSRLTSGLGSARYDVYRVALDELLAHPLVGIGADNFQQQYLLHGRSKETPRYPHSVEMRTLVETGLVGTLLALVGLGAALLACARAIRGSDPLGRAVAAAALAGFGYWVVHGSFDWFWEFAGLGAPAFALLGLGCALQSSTQAAPTLATAGAGRSPALAAPGVGGPARTRRSLRRPLLAFEGRRSLGRRLVAVGAVLATLAVVGSLGAPWLSQLQLESAASTWPRAPQTAYARLEQAANLNPLSDEAFLLSGSIALRYGDLGRADHQFALALGRDPGDAYATLERGAIASETGRRAQALDLLGRAVHLNPRDPIAREALMQVQARRRVSVERLNRAILEKAQLLA